MLVVLYWLCFCFCPYCHSRSSQLVDAFTFGLLVVCFALCFVSFTLSNPIAHSHSHSDSCSLVLPVPLIFVNMIIMAVDVVFG